MLFKPQLIHKIATGEKTQTRRPFRDGEYLKTVNGNLAWCAASGRIKYQVGKTYAVQPGRGLASVYWHPEKQEWRRLEPHNNGKHGFEPLRIRVLELCTEDVREISHDDSLAEGFTKQAEFLATWCNFYDERHADCLVMDKTVCWIDGQGNPYADDVVDFAEWLMLNRPTAPYRGVALKFEIAC